MVIMMKLLKQIYVWYYNISIHNMRKWNKKVLIHSSRIKIYFIPFYFVGMPPMYNIYYYN